MNHSPVEGRNRASCGLPVARKSARIGRSPARPKLSVDALPVALKSSHWPAAGRKRASPLASIPEVITCGLTVSVAVRVALPRKAVIVATALFPPIRLVGFSASATSGGGGLAGTIVSTAERVNPSRFPVMVTVVVVLTERVEYTKDWLDRPAGTRTIVGRATATGLVEVRKTEASPTGAGPLR